VLVAVRSADSGGWLERELIAAGGDGRAIGPVLAAHGRRLGSPALLLVGQAWVLSDTAGVSLAEALDVAVDLLRAARDRRRRLDVALAGPRATIGILSLLPLAGPVVGLVFGISPTALYTGSPLATAAAGLGVVLLAAGHLWCRRMVAAVERIGEG
jgi:tight adherence protein B